MCCSLPAVLSVRTCRRRRSLGVDCVGPGCHHVLIGLYLRPRCQLLGAMEEKATYTADRVKVLASHRAGAAASASISVLAASLAQYDAGNASRRPDEAHGFRRCRTQRRGKTTGREAGPRPARNGQEGDETDEVPRPRVRNGM